MKQIKFIIILCVCCLLFTNTNAQEFRVKNNISKTSQVSGLNYHVLVIEKTEWNCNVSKNGAYYIRRESQKTGKIYKQYLGYFTNKYFENKEIFTNKKKSKYWIFTLGRTNFPKKVYLEII